MKFISWILIIAMAGIAIIGNILKKYVMIRFPTITLESLKNINMWLQLMTTPLALLTLFIGYIFWIVSMVLMQLEDVSKIVMVSAGLAPLTLLATIYLSSIIFNETLTSSQKFGLVLLLVSMAIGIISAYYTSGGFLNEN